jgi:hypothetical protein
MAFIDFKHPKGIPAFREKVFGEDQTHAKIPLSTKYGMWYLISSAFINTFTHASWLEGGGDPYRMVGSYADLESA